MVNVVTSMINWCGHKNVLHTAVMVTAVTRMIDHCDQQTVLLTVAGLPIELPYQ